MAQAQQQGVRPFEGEWAFRASVLGCDGALSGHIFLDATGRAVYLADGVRVVGRGVGHWVADAQGEAAAVELDVFQYAAAATDIPETPHRFRGVWSLAGSPGSPAPVRGDWYFCPDTAKGESMQLVGGFDAAPTTADLLPAAMAGSGATPDSPRVPPHKADALMRALEGQAALRGAFAGDRLEAFRVGNIPTVQYIPDWITPEQEAEFIRIADEDPTAWEDMRTRSSQEWGAGGRSPCGRGLSRQPLPPSQQQLANALHHLGIFDGALFPVNSVRIDGYSPGQGLFPRCDGPLYYPKVAVLSLGSPCVFSFYPTAGSDDSMKTSVLLEPRSLVVFGQDAYWHHRHGIEPLAEETVCEKVCNLDALGGKLYNVGDAVKRTRRISLTMRHLLPRSACMG